jgi:serine/threonine protein kinase
VGIVIERLGRYEILEKIGEGGMGTVYRARDSVIGRVVAIKTVLVSDDAVRKRFVREVKAAGRLQHDHIVTIHDWVPDGAVPHIVMEFVDGESLFVMANRKRLPVRESLRILGEAADALDFAHAAGVIHRDVKPENVLVSRTGRAKLVDFGVARIAGETAMTATDVRLGTPKYIAPEVWLGEPALPASDQFSLAVMAFYLLTGKRPFDSESWFAVMTEITSVPAPAPSSLDISLPRRIDPVLLKALSKHPDDRFASCSAFIEALEQAFRASDDAVTAANSIAQ